MVGRLVRNGLSLKTLIFPIFVAEPERHGDGLLSRASSRRRNGGERWEALPVLRDEVRESPGGEAAIGAAELARGLSYLRASNLQVMRLQLAAEQHDRRGVMAAIDELVGLDRELGRFIDAMPAQVDAGAEIEAQKREVMAGRLMLARGKVGPALAPEAVPDAAPAEPELILDQPVWEEDWLEPEPARRWPWMIGAVLVVAALAIFLFLESLILRWESIS